MKEKGIYSANANFPNDNCDYNDEKLRYYVETIAPTWLEVISGERLVDTRHVATDFPCLLQKHVALFCATLLIVVQLRTIVI